MSGPQKFRKKPVVIEAVQFGGSSSQATRLEDWMAGRGYKESRLQTRDRIRLGIETLEGTMWAEPGDWIIRGVKGEFYPCKPDIFAATYEPAS
jgi:hypothetical protein